MKVFFGVLIVLFLILQYQLWFEQGNLTDVLRLNKSIEKQMKINQELQQRNKAVIAEVKNLKTDHHAVESYARHDLGMVKKDEVYYQVVKEN